MGDQRGPPETVLCEGLRVTMPTLTGRGGSWLEQDVIFEAGSARIDFGTTVHWAEAHRILKVCGLASRYPTASANMNPRAHGLFVALQVEFPLTLDPPAATFETQFGCIVAPNAYKHGAQCHATRGLWPPLGRPLLRRLRGRSSQRLQVCLRGAGRAPIAHPLTSPQSARP